MHPALAEKKIQSNMKKEEGQSS